MKPVLTDGVLAATVKEALRLRDLARADGASREELDANLERTLRAAWPQVRAWKYLCSQCNDTGLAIRLCRRGDRCEGISTRTDLPNQTPGKYQRICAKEPLSDDQHEYGTPCTCATGARFRGKPTPGPEDFSQQAGVAKKKPTRFGR